MIPITECFAQQTQNILLGDLFSEDVAAEDPPVLIKLDPFLSRFSWKKGVSKIVESLTVDFTNPPDVSRAGYAIPWFSLCPRSLN